MVSNRHGTPPLVSHLVNAIRVGLHVVDSSSAQTDSALRRPMTSMADELLNFEWLEANPTECAASSFSQGSAVNKPWESLALPDSAIGFQRDKDLYSPGSRSLYIATASNHVSMRARMASPSSLLSSNQLCSHSLASSSNAKQSHQFNKRRRILVSLLKPPTSLFVLTNFPRCGT